MAEVAAPSSQPQPQPPYLPPHGKKRPAAEGSLEHEQRLSKRFDLLNLVDHSGSRLYIPVPGPSDANLPRPPASPVSLPDSLAFVRNTKAKRPPRPQPASDGMHVEDTPHRVYIHDLNAELSDIESDEDTPIFLSDIEKHLSKIPKHILARPEPKPTENNQVVLYNVPSSLSVPQDRDGVRKAIVEARQRIREKQVNPLSEPASTSSGGDGGFMGTTPIMPQDADAMEID
ncbi:hypothetical protein ACN47E_003002 [Coniothyrium glycines]